jgi:hypothetical protein
MLCFLWQLVPGEAFAQTVTVTVGTPTGTATYGTAATVTYPVTVNLKQGGTSPTYTISVSNTGPAGTGITASLSPASRTGTASGGGTDYSFTMSVTTLATAPAGSFPFTVTASVSSTSTTTVTTTSSSVNFVVNRRPITVTADAKTKVYRTDDPALDYRITTGSLVTGDALTGALTRATGENAGTYAIGQGTLTNAANPNYTITYVGANLVITKKELTVSGVTANNKVYDATTAATINASAAVLSGVESGDNVTLSTTNATGTFDNKNVGTNKPVSISGLSLSGTAGTADITVATLTASTTINNKAYDGNVNATILTPALSGRLGSDDVALDLSTVTAAFIDKNVGTGKQVTVSNLGLRGPDKNNYILASTTITSTASITAKTVSVSGIKAENKVYDGTVAATINLSDATVSGAIGGDKVSVKTTGYTASFASKDVGTGKSVSISGLSLDGDDGINYTLSPTTASATADITKRPLTPVFTVFDKVYDGNRSAAFLTRVASNAVAGEGISLTEGTATFDTKDVATGKLVTGTGFVYTAPGNRATSEATLANYDLTNTSATARANITPKPLTVSGSYTIQSKVYDGTLLATITSPGTASISAGVISPDVVTLDASAATAAFVTKTVGIGKTVNINGLVLTGTDAGNYTITQPTTTGTITVREVGPGFTANSKEYDGNASATIATRSLSNTIDNDIVSLTGGTATFANAAIGDGKTVTATSFTLTGTDAGNYTISPNSATATASITTRTLTASVTISTKVYDGGLSATISGRTLATRVGTEDVTLGTSGTAEFLTKDAGTNKDVAVTGLVLSGAQAGNYTLASSSITAKGAITPKSVSATGITADNKVYDGNTSATVNVTNATSTGFIGGDEVFVIATGATGTFSSKDVGSRTVSITGLSLGGDDRANYTLSPTTASTTATITQKVLTPSFTASNKTYDGNNTAVIASATPIGVVPGETVEIEGGTATFDTKDVGNNKEVTASGFTLTSKPPSAANNYTLSATPVTALANITQRPITVTAAARTKGYGEVDPALTYSLTTGTLATGETLAGTLTRQPGENVGTYPILVGTLASSNLNYLITYVGANLTITVKTLTVTGLTVNNKQYDQTATATFDLTKAALVGVALKSDGITLEDVTLVTSGITGQFVDNKGNADVNAGVNKSVAISGLVLGGADIANYTLVSTMTSTATIFPRDITITAIRAAEKIYDGTTTAVITGTFEGVLSPDKITLASTGDFDTKHVGVGKTVTATNFILGGTDRANYNLANATTTLTTTSFITIRPINVTAQTDSKTYDGTVSSAVSPVGDALQTGDTYTTQGTQSFDTKNAGTGKILTATGAVISDGNSGNNYAITYLTNTTGVISARAINVTAQTDSKTYDGTVTSAVSPVGGALQTGDTYTTQGTQSFDTKNVGTGKTLTATGAVISDGNSGNNYDITYVTNTTGSITQATLTVTAVTGTKVYDGTVTSSGSPTVGTLITGDVVNASPVQVYSTKNVGANLTLTPSGLTIKDANDADMTANYNIAYTPVSTGTITQASLTVNAVIATKVYDGTVTSSVVPTVGTLATGDVVNVAPVQVYSTRNVGTGLTLTPSGLTIKDASNANMTANYDITYTPISTGTITQAALTVTAVIATKVYDGTVTSSGSPTVGSLITGDVVNVAPVQVYSTKNVGTGLTLTPSGLTIKDADNANMTANYDITYTPVSTGSITPKALTITANNQTKEYGIEFIFDGTEFTQTGLVTSVDAITSVTLTSDGTDPLANVIDGPFPIIASNAQGTGLDNYNILYVNGTMTVIAQLALPMGNAYYTGSTYFWTTSSTSSTASLTLAATVKNSPNYGGDIRTSRVSFFIVNGTTETPITGAQNLPVGLVNPDDLTVGTAATTVQYNLGSATAATLTIRVKVTGNYVSAGIYEDKEIMVAVPVTGGQIDGAVDMNDEGSAGYLKGTSNVSFFVKYSKSLKNPQGGVKIIVHSDYDRNGQYDPGANDNKGHIYKLRSNAITTLSVGSGSNPNVAQFTSKANVVEIVDGVEQSIEGNCTMVFDMTDVSRQGEGDMVAITVYRAKGGMWFTSKWDGSKPVQKVIEEGGNVAVSTAIHTSTARESFEAVEPVVLKMNVDVIASPNPVSDQLRVVVSEAGSQPSVRVQLISAEQRLSGSYEVPVVEGRAEHTIDVKHLPEGMYILTVDGQHGRVTRKVLKMN